MSPRRRLLLSPWLVVVLLVAAGVVVGRLVRDAGARPSPGDARPAQDRLGPVLLVPGYGGRGPRWSRWRAASGRRALGDRGGARR